jgi:hypothetical protein
MAFGGVALVMADAMFLPPHVDWPGYRALRPTLGACLIIGGGAMDPGNSVSRLLSTSPLVWIGGLSYSLYLWHWPILVVAEDWLAFRGPRWGLALVVASFLPAWLSHRLLERPLRFSRELVDHPKLAVSTGIGLSLACISASLMIYAAATGAKRPTVGARAIPLGAMALGAHPTELSAGAAQAAYETMTPTPADARADLTIGHERGCLVPVPAAKPVWCELGDREAAFRIAVVGDSKIFQYVDAIDEIGKAYRWNISVANKASCPFADVLVPSAPEQCRAFDREVLARLRASPPNAIITSQTSKRGFSGSDSSTLSPEIMVDGLVRRWSEVSSWGTRVVVILDNPSPTDSVDVYDCLLRYPNDHWKCAFDRKAGIENSAAPVQREAAKRVPNARVIDLTDYICPQPECAPVIGDVLVYRQGTHLTNTYARSLAPILATKLSIALSR